MTTEQVGDLTNVELVLPEIKLKKKLKTLTYGCQNNFSYLREDI